MEILLYVPYDVYPTCGRDRECYVTANIVRVSTRVAFKRPWLRGVIIVSGGWHNHHHRDNEVLTIHRSEGEHATGAQRKIR